MADLPKPVAQVQRMGSYQGVPAYGCLLTVEAERRLKVNDPLFGKAELDAYAAAQVAEERARWQRVADAAQTVTTDVEDRIGHFRVPSHLMAALALALDEAEAAIRRGAGEVENARGKPRR